MGPWQVAPYAYTLRHKQGTGHYARSWMLQGRNVDDEEGKWHNVTVHRNDSSINSSGQRACWPVMQTQPTFYSQFRIVSTGPNSRFMSKSVCVCVSVLVCMCVCVDARALL